MGSDILKIDHHGSKNSTTDEFLQAVSPKVAVTSVGKDNRYGQPASETLEKLKNNNINYLRTDELGDIKIISDGNSFKLKDN